MPPDIAVEFAIRVGRQVKRSRLAQEDLLDANREEVRELEGQGQAGGRLAALDGVHRLPGDPQPQSQVRLGPVTLGAEYFETVLHVGGPFTGRRVSRS